MKKLVFYFIAFIFLFCVSCSAPKVKKSKIILYHGIQPPEGYVSVLNFSPKEIEFRIRVKFKDRKLYHIIADEEGNFIAEGWYRTSIDSTGIYYIKMKAKKGFKFQSGKKYRLCIGKQNPELMDLFTSKYRCLVDYEFVLPTHN